MNHILDNPTYNALISGNKNLSVGTEAVKYFLPEVAGFAGLKATTPANLEELYRIIPAGRTVGVISPDTIVIEQPWKTINKMAVLQMIYEGPLMKNQDVAGIVPLGGAHIKAMISLNRLTAPGPFLSNTISFGNYKGIFINDQLIAMAGYRLQPFDYTEISAVCTHPDHTGKGYARKLMLDQVHDIQSRSSTPFLHVKSENERAVGIYKKLGFSVRKEMTIYILTK